MSVDVSAAEGVGVAGVAGLYGALGLVGPGRTGGGQDVNSARFYGTDQTFLCPRTSHVPKPPETLTIPLPVTLEEVNEGVTKTCTAAVRTPSAPGGEATAMMERSFTVRVAPGALSETRYPFVRKGHQDPGRPPGDVVLVLQELPHPRFTRHGADLVQSETVSLREALTGCTVLVVTLDDRLIRVAITDIVRPGYEKRLSGEGLPLLQAQQARQGARPGLSPSPWRVGNQDRGALVLRMDVQFPLSLSRACKVLLDQALRHQETSTTTTESVVPSGRGDGDGVARAVLDEKMERQSEQSGGAREKEK